MQENSDMQKLKGDIHIYQWLPYYAGVPGKLGSQGAININKIAFIPPPPQNSICFRIKRRCIYSLGGTSQPPLGQKKGARAPLWTVCILLDS